MKALVSLPISILVAVTVLVAVWLSARDALRSPADSPFVRWGSMLLSAGFALMLFSWVRGESMLVADAVLLTGVTLLYVSRRRRERQPFRGFRRRA